MTAWTFDAVPDAVDEADAILDVRDDIDQALEGLPVELKGLEADYESARATDDLLPQAEKSLEAAEAYRAADNELDEGKGPLGVVGLLGSGVEDELDTAADELESGDPEASLRASRDVQQRLDNATRDGTLRLAAVAVVLAFLAFLILRIRRFRRRRGMKRIEKAADKQLAPLAPLGPLNGPATKPTEEE